MASASDRLSRRQRYSLWLKRTFGMFERRFHRPMALFHTRLREYPGNLYWLVVAAIAVFHVNMIRALPSELQVDSKNVYLPGAEALLEKGLAFFATPDSYHTAPLNFIWPALFAAQAEAIVSANIVLSVLCLGLMFATGRLLAGTASGLAAAALYGVSPLIAPLFTTVLSEPVFLFGTALWLFGTAASLTGQRRLFLAAFGGVVSVLARPVWLPFIVLAVPACVMASMLWPQERAWKTIVSIHLIILGVVGSYCLHNYAEFGFFGVSTGGGAALYLGNHPLTLGLEPQYLLLDYDVQSLLIPWQGQHLSIEGDAVLRAIGWSMIRDRSLSAQIDWLGFKAATFLFFTKGDFAAELYSIRALRVFEVICGLYGLHAIRSRPLTLWMCSALMVQLGQLTFVLYNRRYSVGSLEPWLILLAGSGIGRIVEGVRAKVSLVRYGIRAAVDVDPRKGWVGSRLAVIAVAAAGIGFAHWHRRLTEPVHPDVDAAPTRLLMQLDYPAIDEDYSKNIVRLPNGAYFTTRREEGLFAIRMPATPQKETGFNTILTITMTIVPPEGKECRDGRISYEPDHPLPNWKFEAIPIEFKGDGKTRRYAISATYPLSPLYMGSEGILRFRTMCPEKTQIGVHSIALLESTAPKYYLSRVKQP